MSAKKEELVEILQKVTYGTQDAEIERLGNTKPPTYEKVIEHVSAKLVTHGSYAVYEFPVYSGLAIANIHLVGDNWSSASFMINGSYYDRLHSVTHGSSFWITDRGRCLPSVMNSSFSIQAYKNNANDVGVEYDIVEPMNCSHDVSFVYESNQMTGITTINSGVSNVKLYYNHPVKKIIIDVLKGSVDAIELEIEMVNHPTLPFQKVSDSQFVLDYGENTINFSRIENEWIKVIAKEESVICPYAITLNIMRILPTSGEIRVAFA